MHELQDAVQEPKTRATEFTPKEAAALLARLLGSDRIHNPIVVNKTISASIGNWLITALRAVGKIRIASTCAK